MQGDQASVVPAGVSLALEERRLVAALGAGDEQAFVRLVRQHGPTMLRVARRHASDRAVAEEVVQETWLAVLTGIGRFEGRSSFKTWLFRILTNRAKTRAATERRSVSFTALGDEEVAAAGLAVVPERLGAGEHRARHWISSPERWTDVPEAHLISNDTIAVVEQAAASLPPAQRAVVTLRRDVLTAHRKASDVLRAPSEGYPCPQAPASSQPHAAR